jgi:hypothetical protein
MKAKVSGGGARFGCFTYGCGFALILGIVLFGGLGYYYVTSLRSAFNEYSAEQSPALPPLMVDTGITDVALGKLAVIRAAVDQKSSVLQTFSEAELNGLISRSIVKDALRVSLSGDEVSAQFSFAPSLFGEWRAAQLVLGSSYNRFFNGTCKAKVSVNSGVASVNFTELNLNGHTLEDMARGHASQWVSGAINSSAKESTEGVGEQSYVSSIRSLIIKDGMLQVSLGAP